MLFYLDTLTASRLEPRLQVWNKQPWNSQWTWFLGSYVRLVFWPSRKKLKGEKTGNSRKKLETQENKQKTHKIGIPLTPSYRNNGQKTSLSYVQYHKINFSWCALMNSIKQVKWRPWYKRYQSRFLRGPNRCWFVVVVCFLHDGIILDRVFFRGKSKGCHAAMSRVISRHCEMVL